MLRPFTMADGSEVLRLIAGDEEIARNTLRIPYPYTLAHAEEWLSRHDSMKNEIVLAITLRDGGALAGCVGIVVNANDRRGEIGYWIAREHRRRGLTTEAVRRMIAYAFDELALNRIEAEHFARNPASGRVMLKCGMRREGTLRQRHIKWEEPVDCEIYSILRSEWHEDAE